MIINEFPSRVTKARFLAEECWSLDFAAGRYVSPDGKVFYNLDTAYEWVTN